MRILQSSPTFSSPQQASPSFPSQYPAPYTPVQTGGFDISSIMELMMMMMVMGMMMSMMKGMFAQIT